MIKCSLGPISLRGISQATGGARSPVGDLVGQRDLPFSPSMLWTPQLPLYLQRRETSSKDQRSQRQPSPHICHNDN